MATVVAIGVGLAALAGVVLAPIRGVHPAMGSEIITAAPRDRRHRRARQLLGSGAGLDRRRRGPRPHGLFRPTVQASMALLLMFPRLVRPRGLLGERFERLEA